MFPRKSPRLLVWAMALTILAIAAYLRFDGLAEPSLWLDEILHYEKTQEAAGEPWHAWLTGLSVDRENGALYYAGQLLALKLFDGEFAVRLVSALAGLATVGVLFLVGLSAGGRRVAVVAAALLAVSPLHVYYSREGRPYAAVMLAAALILLLALEHRRRWARVAVYGVCVAAAYLGAVAAPVLLSCAALAALEWLRRTVPLGGARGVKGSHGHFALAALLGLAVVALLFPRVTREGRALGTGEHAAKWEIIEPLSTTAFDRLLASLTVSGTDWGSANVLSFLFLALAVWGGFQLARADPSKAVWVVGLCVLPVLGWMAALTVFGHWYNVRYTSAGLPAFLVLVAVGVVDVCRRLWTVLAGARFPRAVDALVAAALVLFLAPAWRTARAEPLEKPDWRGVAELIGDLSIPGEPVIVRDRWAATCIGHYLERSRRSLEVIPVHFDVTRAKRLTKRHRRGWVLAAGYRETAEFQAWMETLDLVSRSRLANLELYYFPGFRAFVSRPSRSEGLASVLAEREESATRQDFTHSELLLGSGWSYPETSPDGTTFRWAVADRAEMALLTSGTTTLRLRLLPFTSPDRPPQAVAVSVDSRPLTRITLDPGWNEISLPVVRTRPAAVLVAFDFAWRQSPRALDGSPDPRELAVAFDYVEAVPAAATD